MIYCEQVDRRLVRASAQNFETAMANSGSDETAPNSVMEDWNLKSSGLLRCPDGTAFDGVDQCGALPEPGSEDLVHKISDGLPARGDRETLRHCAMPESGELRKNEPHPVSLLPAAAQFVEHPR